MEAGEVISRFVSSKYAIYVIHGDYIEPGTEEIAKSIAGEDSSLYCASQGKHHIPSILYNEPKALDLALKVDTIISIHGEHDAKESFVMVGGLDKEIVERVKHRLVSVGFVTKEPPD